MASRIEDYAVIGNCATLALVGRDGSIDWLCLPRFDSGACFAALLGTPEEGRWQIAPADPPARTTRRYREGTLVLETSFETADGSVLIVDCMTLRDGVTDLIRLVRGTRGRVVMRSELAVRFDYGSAVPWVSRLEDGRLRAVAGPDRLILQTDAVLEGEGMRTVGTFTIAEGEEVPFVLSWTPSYRPIPEPIDGAAALERTSGRWRSWSAHYRRDGPWSDAVRRSLITLKALTHHETGGIVAAGTTSLPEKLGGERNWDYRYCWLRDSTLTLQALLDAGFVEEARDWRDWLIRAAAGSPEKLQIMYGVAGERRLPEVTLPWLPGYEKSLPVRIGNAASEQLQLDVYGEVIATLYHGWEIERDPKESSWALATTLIEHLETIWQQPDSGLWETRGDPRHFTHSKVMAWVAIDRAVRSVETLGLEGPLAHWRELRQRIHDDVCANGFDRSLGAFVQSYGSRELDASLLLIPVTGFLPPSDPRVSGTIEAIRRELVADGFVLRYRAGPRTDGLPPGEGAFLACSFWLADSLVMLGRPEEAREIFEHLLSLRNDVGLLAEEYSPHERRLVGNFPQAFSHVGLINTAHNLSRADKPAETLSGHRAVR